jgi:hypothetical protein
LEEVGKIREFIDLKTFDPIPNIFWQNELDDDSPYSTNFFPSNSIIFWQFTE